MNFFEGANNTTINGGNFNAVSNPAANFGPQNDIVALLYSHSARAGLLDAKERFDAPKCGEGTRVSMIRGMKAFVQHGSAASSPGLYWLHGPAGVGKSALAQSVSLKLQSEGDHAASFFFSRTSPGRSNGNQLVVTLAYQLAVNFPALQPFMSTVVRRNPAVLNASNMVQMKSLIIDPISQWQKEYNRGFQRWKNRLKKVKLPPRLVLVDGLDECNDPDVQTDLIRCITSAVRQLSIPLRFVVTSRPESHILAAFEPNNLSGVEITKKNLGEDEHADEQITTFLLKEFAEIRRTHPIRNFLPPQWPRPDQVAQLVAKSSKGFIYATTVIRYIKMPQNRPDLCLDRILGLSELPTSDKPYEPLDILYRYVFESVPETNKRSINDIFHLLVLLDKSHEGKTRDSTTIEQLFNYPPGHVQHVLHDLLCLVELTPEGSIKVLHASLPDFLLDKSRSGPLCIGIGDVHATYAAYYLMTSHHTNDFFLISSGLLDHLQKANNSNDLLNERILQTDLVRQYKNIPKSMHISSPIEEMAFMTAYLIILRKSSGQQIYIRNQTASLKDYVFREYPLLRSLLPEFISVLAPWFRNWKLRTYSKDVCRIFEWKFDSSQNELREAIFETLFLMVALRYQKIVPVSYPQPRLTSDGPHYWADIVYPQDDTDGSEGSLLDTSSFESLDASSSES